MWMVPLERANLGGRYTPTSLLLLGAKQGDRCCVPHQGSLHATPPRLLEQRHVSHSQRGTVCLHWALNPSYRGQRGTLTAAKHSHLLALHVLAHCSWSSCLLPWVC